jgi:hypothetical protein
VSNADPQDQAEALDDDRLAGEYPPEEPLGVEDYGTTAAEERWDEPLAERVRREEPDDSLATSDFEVDPEVGALDEGDPLTGDDTTRDIALERVAPPAEEAAMHVTDLASDQIQ